MTEIHGNVIVNGDFIGRDQIIYQIQQRALTAAEEAKRAREIEDQALAEGLAGLIHSIQVRINTAELPMPYKGLLAYELQEAENFYGRTQAIQSLLNCIHQGPLTILHAESGSGKTSLLQAGIAARLIAAGHLALHLRPYDTAPHDFIRRAFLPDPNVAPNLNQAPLQTLLRKVCALLGNGTRLYIFLDQFEDFFTQLDQTEQKSFLTEFFACLHDPGLDVHWVIALRAEWFSRLAEFEKYGIAPFKNTFRLACLTREEAADAITQPAQKHGLTLSTERVSAILDELTSEAGIIPPQLQLVGMALFELHNSGQLSDTTVFRCEDVLRGYLKRQMEQLPAGERKGAWQVLRELVRSDGQRSRKSAQQLVTILDQPEQIETILTRLVERRLLIRQENMLDGILSYELAHDYLVQEIDLDPREQGRKAAQELLEQELRAFARHGSLITKERLQVIESYLDVHRLNPEQQELVNRSRAKQVINRRWRNFLLAFVISLALVIGVLGLWGLNNARTAEENLQIAEENSQAAERSAQIAEEERNIALARQLAAQAVGLLNIDITQQEIAMLLATQSNRLYPNSEATQVLNSSTLAPLHSLITYGEHVYSAIAFSPDGRLVVTGSSNGTIRLRETLTGIEIARMTHGESVIAIALSPDGRLVASGSEDGTIIVWDIQTGIKVAHISHKNSVGTNYSLTFSPDGQFFVLNGDYTAHVWDIQTGIEVAHMDHEDGILSIAISPDGRFIVSGSRDGTARVWEAQTGIEVSRWTQLVYITTVAFSSDGRFVIAGSRGGNVHVWEAQTGIEVADMHHKDAVFSVAISSDNRFVVSGSMDATARVWELSTGYEIAHMNHENTVQVVAFSPDGRFVVSGSTDGTARVWNAQTGIEVARMDHDNWVEVVAFSSDNRFVVSGSLDGTARVWDAYVGTEVSRMVHEGYKAGVYAMEFSPDGQFMVSGGWDTIAYVWDTRTSNEVSRMTIESINKIEAVDLSPDGRWVVLGCLDGTVRVWDAQTSTEVARMTHDYAVRSIAFSPNGRWVVSGSYDNTARVWDAQTGTEVVRMTHEDIVTSVSFSPDGRFIVSGSSDGTARVWDAQTGTEVARMTHESGVDSASFSPDGNFIVSGSVDNTARVWEAQTGVEVARMTHEDIVTSVSFSPDGDLIVSGSWDNTVRVWDAQTGTEVARMTHEGWVTSVGFSPDGRFIVSGSSDGTARVYEARTGIEIARMTHEREVQEVAFSPAGRFVASGSEDGTIFVWPYEPQYLIDNACSRVTRNLTHDEWEQYIGDALPYQAVCPNLPLSHGIARSEFTP